MRIRLAVAALVMAGNVLMPASALAAVPTETQCASEIVDGANLFKGDIAGISNAADQLKSLEPGTIVIVRTYPKIRDTLRATLADSIRDCPNWRDVQGRQLATSLFFMVSLDSQRYPRQRELAIYAGDTFGPALVGSGAEERIRLNTMTPRFKQGKFAEGMTTAMQQSYQALHPGPAAASTTPTVSNGPVDTPVTNPPRTDSAPTDWSWLTTFLKWLLGIVLLAITIIGLWLMVSAGWHWLSAWLRERQRQQALLDDATKLRPRLTDLIQRAESLSRDEHPSANGWLVRLRTVSTALQQAGTDVSQLGTGMSDWKTETNEVADELSAFDARVRLSDVELQSSRDRYAVVAALVQDLIRGGWTSDGLADQLETIKSHLAAANSHREAGRNVNAIILIDQANAQIATLVPALQALKDRREAFTVKLQKLGQTCEFTSTDIDKATAEIVRLSSTYAPSAWEQLKGNGAKATALLEDSRQQMKSASANFASGNLDEADAHLAQAEKQLADARSLMRSVRTLADGLDKTAVDLPRLLSAAQEALSKAREAEHKFDDDAADAHKAELDAINTMLAKAERLCQAKPLDPQAAAAAIRDADRQTDKVYNAVMSEHEAAERERQRAIDEARSAQTSIDKAREYLQDHSSHVRQEDQEALDTAHKALKSLNQLMASDADPADKIKAAQRAAALAENAYQPVRQRVLEIQRRREEAAEAERRRLARQRAAAQAAAEAAAEAERQRAAAARKKAEEEAERYRPTYTTPSYLHVDISGNGGGTWGGSSIWSGGSDNSGTSGGSNTW